MRVERYLSARAFLAAVGDHLLRSEAENALILGMAHAWRGASPPPEPMPYFVAVYGRSSPLLAAFSNHPEKLGVTQAGDSGAIAPLVEHVRGACAAICDVGGPEPTVGMVAAEFARQSGHPSTRLMGLRVHQLDAVEAIDRRPAGQLRIAVEADLPQLVPWVESFHREGGQRPGDADAEIRGRVLLGQQFVWDNAGLVSMAGWTGKTPNGARVSLVFTPPELRGKGYATATVAALSQRLLAEGNRFCCLYTDVANPVSNAIYARIGYRPVCEAGMYRVGTRPQTRTAPLVDQP